jgi:cation transport protein ChaC
MAEITAQINRCTGPSGSNRDYVLELARALRGMGFSDSHVFEVEAWILAEKTAQL